MSEDNEENSKNDVETLKDDSTEHGSIKGVLQDSWMIRDCNLYKDEYDECTSFRGRFHQYFIYGQSLDCNQWQKDFNNCVKWTGDKDIKAANSLIDSEKERRQARFRAHYRNDTWKKRSSPPDDFNKPLPEWMVKRDESSILAVEAKNLREGVVEEEKSSMCSIM